MARLTAQKARIILHEGMARGHEITAKQRRLFGFIASGGRPTRLRDHGFFGTNDMQVQSTHVIQQNQGMKQGLSRDPVTQSDRVPAGQGIETSQ